MYQVVAVSESPTRRMKMGAFPTQQAAVDNAVAGHPFVEYEIVDDRTGLLKASVEDGKVDMILVPTRRDIL